MSGEVRDSKLRSRIVTAGILAALIGAALVYRDALVAWFAGPTAPIPPAAQTDDGAADYYTCTMHPSVRSPDPGQCPICGMDLTLVTKEQQTAGVVTIPAARQQLIGVRTMPVTERPMVQSLRVVGRLAYDESTLIDVSLKVRGWIVKLFVNNTGQRVKKGQTLFTLYSPELYAAQQDFLLATRGQSAAGHGSALAQAARQRLRLLDLSDAQIDEIQARGQPLENVPFSAQQAGYVIEKEAVEGAAFEPGMRLYRLASLDKIWIEADVYEADFARVRVGQRATVTLDYLPGRTYDARVAYVYPYLNAEARTGRVRLELVNKKLELRPGMYANVHLQADLGPKLQVPSSAVVYTGPRRLVFVDLGDGRFRPQEVKVGAEADGWYEVLSGLTAGDVVASSGVFLIAAEARISTASKYWESRESGEIGSTPTALAPPHEDEHDHASAPSKPRLAPTRVAPPASPLEAATRAHEGEHAADVVTAPAYTCPMHPDVHAPSPGKCPICGMNLVPEKPSTPQ